MSMSLELVFFLSCTDVKGLMLMFPVNFVLAAKLLYNLMITEYKRYLPAHCELISKR